jgi:hypothetical protein
MLTACAVPALPSINPATVINIHAEWVSRRRHAWTAMIPPFLLSKGTGERARGKSMNMLPGSILELVEARTPARSPQNCVVRNQHWKQRSRIRTAICVICPEISAQKPSFPFHRLGGVVFGC